MTTASITDFGAIGDGVTDDRAAIQAALDACADGTVVVPLGTFAVGKGAGFWCLRIPSGTRLAGLGTLRQLPVPASVRLLQVEAPGVTIDGVTLDGAKDTQTVDEHRSGVFATGAIGLVLRGVTAQNFTGDGFYIYNHSDNVTVDGVTATGNARNGLTLGGLTTGTTITGSRFAGNGAQQLDSEPGVGWAVNDVEISDCVIDVAGVSTEFALTVSGSSSTARSARWSVHDNVINGAINVVWADDVEIRGNGGVNATTHPAVTLWRTTNRVSIVGNRWTQTQNTVDSLSAIYVGGTGVGSVSSRVYVAGNVIVVLNRAKSFGVRAEGFHDLIVEDNLLVGPGLVGGYAGIWLRATIIGDDVRSAVVRRNRVYDWGGQAVSVSGNGAAVFRLLDVSDNVFADGAGTMTAGMSLDDGTGCARDVRQSGNMALGGVATMVARAPAGVWSAWGSGDRWLVP